MEENSSSESTDSVEEKFRQLEVTEHKDSILEVTEHEDSCLQILRAPHQHKVMMQQQLKRTQDNVSIPFLFQVA